VNTLWALLNLAIGYVLFRAGHVSDKNLAACLTFFAGVVAMSIMLSVNFAKKDRE
jgi:hypothetical protein